jgi:hypothetical protein
MAAGPQFAATPNVGVVQLPATAMGGTLISPTGTTTLFTAGASGSRVDVIRFNQISSSTAVGFIYVFIARGGTFYLWDVVGYGIATLSATVQSQPVEIPYNDLLLKSGDTLAVVNSVTTNGQWSIVAEGGDF